MFIQANMATIAEKLNSVSEISFSSVKNEVDSLESAINF